MAACVAWWDISSFSHTAPKSRRCAAVQQLSCGSFLFVCAVLRSLVYIHCQAMATATTTSSGVNGSVSTASAFAAKHLH